MREERKDNSFKAETTLDLSAFTTDIAAWLCRQPAVGEKQWLLAYAEDGVIWGKIENGQLQLSKDQEENRPLFNPLTLLEARLFGESAEVHVWRSEGEFQACRIEDKVQTDATAFDEEQHLWGTAAVPSEGSFTLLEDGQQGLRHAVPLVVESRYFHERTLYRPVVLCTRSYIGFDEDGQAKIVASRLMELKVIHRREKQEASNESA